MTDYRPLVLILMVALTLAAGWRTPQPDAQRSAYYWADGTLIRTNGSRAGQGVPLRAGLSCEDTPPEVARFFNLPLPINRADQRALIALPGIGPKLSQKIIAYRDAKGGITGPDDFLRVNGIGPKRMASLSPLLCFAGARKAP